MTYHNCLPFWSAVCLLVLGTGWVRPQVPTSAKPVAAFGEKLDYMVIQVNEQERIVRDGDVLAVVAGDEVAVRSVHLKEDNARALSVNVVGYQKPGAPAGADLGLTIDTAKELMPKWSEGKKGETWAVTATSKGALHGTVFIRLVKPALKYAVLSINGAERVFRDGEVAEIAASDMVKVKRVATNLESVDDVVFQIHDPEPESADRAGKTYEVRFLRDDKVFARIPLRIRD